MGRIKRVNTNSWDENSRLLLCFCGDAVGTWEHTHLRLLYVTVSTLKPMVGTVSTTSPSFSLYRMVVLPAASVATGKKAFSENFAQIPHHCGHPPPKKATLLVHSQPRKLHRFGASPPPPPTPPLLEGRIFLGIGRTIFCLWEGRRQQNHLSMCFGGGVKSKQKGDMSLWNSDVLQSGSMIQTDNQFGTKKMLEVMILKLLCAFPETNWTLLHFIWLKRF